MIRFMLSEFLRSVKVRKRSLIIAVLNVAVAIFVLAGILQGFRLSGRFLNEYRSQSKIDAFISPDADPVGVSSAVLDIPMISRAEFLSEDEAMKQFRELRGDVLARELADALAGAPFPPLLRIHLASNTIDPEPVVVALRGISGIDAVFYGGTTATRLRKLAEIHLRIAGAIGIGGTILGFLMVGGFTRAAMESRRAELAEMIRWGANDRFVVLPLFFEGGVLGIAGAILGVGFLLIALTCLANETSSGMQFALDPSEVSGAILLAFLAGAAGGVIATVEASGRRLER